jgi:hypothetical protein
MVFEGSAQFCTDRSTSAQYQEANARIQKKVFVKFQAA